MTISTRSVDVSMYVTYFHDNLEEIGGRNLVGISQALVDIDGILLSLKIVYL